MTGLSYCRFSSLLEISDSRAALLCQYLSGKIDQQNLSKADKESFHAELRIKRPQMEEIVRYKTEGAIIRSNIMGYNQGERNTEYFHSLEKHHFNCKTIRNLKTENNVRISKDTEILAKQKEILRVPLLL